jgi:hypothetical protein
MAHKLPGELVTASDPEGRATIFDRLRVMGLTQHLMPVGRLDFNTEGLLLLTNDGDYARQLEHPKSEIPRVYRALVRGNVRLQCYCCWWWWMWAGTKQERGCAGVRVQAAGAAPRTDRRRRQVRSSAQPVADGIGKRLIRVVLFIVVTADRYRPIHASVQSTDKKDSWLQVRITEGKVRRAAHGLSLLRCPTLHVICRMAEPRGAQGAGARAAGGQAPRARAVRTLPARGPAGGLGAGCSAQGAGAQATDAELATDAGGRVTCNVGR